MPLFYLPILLFREYRSNGNNDEFTKSRIHQVTGFMCYGFGYVFLNLDSQNRVKMDSRYSTRAETIQEELQ